MAVRNRTVLAIGIFALLAAVVILGRWYDTHRAQAQRSTQKDILVHVTNGSDRGPGTLREALLILAAAPGPGSISIEVPSISLETALPALVNGHGVRLLAQTAGAQIDSQGLNAGPVLDISGPDTAIEGLTIKNCPGAAILVRAVRFHLSDSRIESCDVGVELAATASDALLERNHFYKNRLGVRFAASGRNAVVANNEFSEHKDTALWAVRSTPDAHDDAIGIHDNKFTEDQTGIVAGNIPVRVERNDFINIHEAAVHVVGAGAVIRGNRIDGGASMGIIAENARGAIVENNELQGIAAYGVMVRGSANTLVQANRLYNCGYGLAFVLGDAHSASSAVDNTIIEPKFNGIDVVGDSPILRRNQVLRAHAYALNVQDFQAANGQKVQAQPFLDNNNFGNSPVSRNTMVAAPANPQ